mmetsp:Transcript_13824/g.20967  ORF Transcript_13824/g.20967 Transcript_13824/m.20967 type:complete len:128 (+) Transcript_13824:579-962(+)
MAIMSCRSKAQDYQQDDPDNANNGKANARNWTSCIGPPWSWAHGRRMEAWTWLLWKMAEWAIARLLQDDQVDELVGSAFANFEHPSSQQFCSFPCSLLLCWAHLFASGPSPRYVADAYTDKNCKNWG